MSDPRRLLEDAGALSPDERRILEAELRLQVPKNAKTAVLGAVFARLPNGGGELPGELDPTGTLGTAASGAHGASAAAGSALLLAFAKPAAVGFALGVATTVAWVGGRSTLERASEHSPPPVQTASANSATTPSARVPTPAQGESVTPPTNEAVDRGSESIATVPHQNQNQPQLAPTSTANLGQPSEAPSIRAFPDEPPDGSVASAESQRLAAARTLLRSGNARGALSVLERLRTDFPRGVLVQERESLEIEALLASGDRATAEARARDFLARYPKSPHAAAARRALER